MAIFENSQKEDEYVKDKKLPGHLCIFKPAAYILPDFSCSERESSSSLFLLGSLLFPRLCFSIWTCYVWQLGSIYIYSMAETSKRDHWNKTLHSHAGQGNSNFPVGKTLLPFNWKLPNYCTAQLERALWLVNLAGCISLYGPLNQYVGFNWNIPLCLNSEI